MNDARLEADIFEDLRHLCQSPGYVHAIGFFCFRDNLIRFGDQLNSEAMESQHAPDRLLRTEIATLIGLMVQVPFDAAVPAPAQFQAYIDQTQALLKELHDSLSAGWLVGFRPSDGLMSISDPFSSGENLREPMFYAGESAYGFQYSAFAELKHAVDDGWLLEKKGFEIADAVRLAQALENILTERQMAQSKALRGLPPENWTMLPGFTFTLEEVLAVSDLDAKRAVAVLSAFTLPAEDRNSRFTGLNAFNATNAMPILHHGAGDYLLLQQYSLLESIYESPFFWMMGDPDYKAKALTHRGEFTETFAMQTLREVFGAGRVHQNVDIYHPNGQRLGEIDVLVVYGSRAIVVQAKSKRLTIEARSGNDRQLKRDFKLA
ncbi:MAG: NERD domain-containing protein, partial [Alphaproteobacteria bacterium]|nr:NERD domain-containing protein [Alphaproteobacteria bacterium]